MNEIIKYEVGGTEVALSPQIVRDYLVQGNGRVTDQEVAMFIELCRFKSMNPFLREAYLIKYGDRQPAAIVTGKDYFTRKAAENPACRGWEAGIVFRDQAGEIQRRKGTFLDVSREELLGGYAIVFREGWEPLETSVTLLEYVRYTYKDGKKVMQSNWRDMPATMIRKVALVQALREAFPEQFGGLYSPEEMPNGDVHLDTDVVMVENAPEPLEEITEDDLPPAKDELLRLGETLSEIKASLCIAKRITAKDASKIITDHVKEAWGKTSPKQLTRREWRELFAWIEGEAENEAAETIQEVFGEVTLEEEQEER